MHHYFALFLVFCNVRAKTVFWFRNWRKGASNSILLFSYFRVFRVLHQNYNETPLTPGVQANENNAAEIFEISKL